MDEGLLCNSSSLNRWHVTIHEKRTYVQALFMKLKFVCDFLFSVVGEFGRELPAQSARQKRAVERAS